MARPGGPGLNQYPLRKVLRMVADVNDWYFDELECGHYKRWMLDLELGRLGGTRRRCRCCYWEEQGKPLKRIVLPVFPVRLIRVEQDLSLKNRVCVVDV